MKALLTLAVAMATSGTALAQEAPIKVLAAGSLRAALTDVARAFEAEAPAYQVELGFGASGLLKDRLAGGERADVFASANMDHPQALADAGKAEAPKPFARNLLCALGGGAFRATPETLVERLLDPAVRVATSTPRADPAGDYAFEMFERIEKSGRPGARKILADKALQLTGGPDSPPPPRDRNVYGAILAAGQADVFITYCTNAVVARREVPGLSVVDVPPAVNVSARYGVSVMNGATPMGRDFVRFLLSPEGQAVLARHGFAPP